MEKTFYSILDNRLHIYEIYISSADNNFCHLCNIDTFISLLREIYDIFTTLKQLYTNKIYMSRTY